jgi:hypothetical protein
MDKMDGDKVRQYVDYMIQRLDNMDEQAEKLHKHAPAMFSRQDAEEFKLVHHRLMQLLSWARPETLCKFCDGRGCRACGGSGWTNEFRIKVLVPRELRDAP